MMAINGSIVRIIVAALARQVSLDCCYYFCCCLFYQVIQNFPVQLNHGSEVSPRCIMYNSGLIEGLSMEIVHRDGNYQIFLLNFK